MVQAETGKGRSPRRRHALRVACVITVIALPNWAMWSFLQDQHPQYWVGLRRQLLGPFDGFPLVRTQYLLVLALVLVVDLLLLRSKSALAALIRFGRSERVDIALAAIRLWGLGIALPALFSLGLTAIIPRFLALHRPDWGSVSAITRNPVLQLLLYSMIVDFLRYWLHRWMHESTVLWRFHRLHHSAESFTVLTGNRQHPVEDILAVPVVVLPLTLLGATPVQVVLVIVIRTILDMAQHSMVPFSYGWFGRWIF